MSLYSQPSKQKHIFFCRFKEENLFMMQVSESQSFKITMVFNVMPAETQKCHSLVQHENASDE